jgi:hypothetical protein
MTDFAQELSGKLLPTGAERPKGAAIIYEVFFCGAAAVVI